MAYLSIAVPSYNSEGYLARCLDSLLPHYRDLEVIIVNDGSKDKTAEIAAKYAALYPDHFILINKENGGHGSGVNVALERASAPWFKVLDSDDRFDEEGLRALLALLKRFGSADGGDAKQPDLILTNFVFEIHRESDGAEVVENKTQDYRNIFKPELMRGWDDMGSFKVDQSFMMHAFCYRSQILKDMGLRMPEKCYYEDNLYIYEPLPKIENIYYLDTELYLYYIGRKDQSINMENIIKNVEMQIRVTLEMIRRVRLGDVQPQRLRRYMFRQLVRMMAMCIMPLGIEGSSQSLARLDEIWREIEGIDAQLYKKLKAHPMLGSQLLLAKAGSYLNEQIYSLIGKAFPMG